jgi:hypothetical protein
MLCRAQRCDSALSEYSSRYWTENNYPPQEGFQSHYFDWSKNATNLMEQARWLWLHHASFSATGDVATRCCCISLHHLRSALPSHVVASPRQHGCFLHASCRRGCASAACEAVRCAAACCLLLHSRRLDAALRLCLSCRCRSAPNSTRLVQSTAALTSSLQAMLLYSHSIPARIRAQIVGTEWWAHKRPSGPDDGWMGHQARLAVADCAYSLVALHGDVASGLPLDHSPYTCDAPLRGSCTSTTTSRTTTSAKR